MIVAGVMSGTSADGIDVAVVRISEPHPSHKNKNAARVGHPDLKQTERPKLTLLAHEGFAYPAALRHAVLAAMNAPAIAAADLARLNWRLGLAYAEAVQQTAQRHKIKLDLVGCHGQTLYHQAQPAPFLGRKFACTWQAGEAQAIAALGIPVVSNFRPADIFAGGQGAPLVPFLDYALFAHPRRGRVLQNIGGIANLTAIPAGAPPHEVVAFDSGPGNMIVDWLAQKLFGRKFDRGGALAARGNILEAVLKEALQNPYFRLPPPKTAGREQFGREYAAKFLAACRRASKNPEDALATATALTAETIARSYARFVLPKMMTSGAKAPTDGIALAARLKSCPDTSCLYGENLSASAKISRVSSRSSYRLKPVPINLKPEHYNQKREYYKPKPEHLRAEANPRHTPVDYIVSGGGAHNRALMAMLDERLAPLRCKLATSDALGLPAEAKEAAAFALLAWQTWNHLPANVPAATGASRPAILGQVTYA
jgi:anhydro-N-acetylmuramic acid kinase